MRAVSWRLAYCHEVQALGKVRLVKGCCGAEAEAGVRVKHVCEEVHSIIGGRAAGSDLVNDAMPDWLAEPACFLHCAALHDE